MESRRAAERVPDSAESCSRCPDSHRTSCANGSAGHLVKGGWGRLFVCSSLSVMKVPFRNSSSVPVSVPPVSLSRQEPRTAGASSGKHQALLFVAMETEWACLSLAPIINVSTVR